MSATWQNRLRELWKALNEESDARQRQFRTRRVSTELALPIYAAVRAPDEAPCLLLHFCLTASDLFEVGGMRLSAGMDGSEHLAVLSLEDSERIDLFTLVCADMISASEGADATEATRRFLARLDAWRRFLRERHSGLSREETVGLLGELVVLERILELDVRLQTCWRAPQDGLHDFERDGYAIEVKASLGPVSVVQISSLDQLDVSGVRELNLFHVRMIDAPQGRCLGSLIHDISKRLPDETSRQDFGNALLQRGLMPDDDAARTRPIFELRSLDSYWVNEDFPRLSRISVPGAVTDASYGLDIRALAGHTTEAVDILRSFAGASR